MGIASACRPVGHRGPGWLIHEQRGRVSRKRSRRPWPCPPPPGRCAPSSSAGTRRSLPSRRATRPSRAGAGRRPAGGLACRAAARPAARGSPRSREGRATVRRHAHGAR
eukprot:4473222-Prymnesium_polylepis.2